MIISGGIDLAPGAIIALTTVITGYLFVVSGMAAVGGRGRGTAGRRAGRTPVVMAHRARSTAAVHRHARRHGHLRGAAFIITEARFYDLSAKLPRDWHVAGISIDWLGPIVMIGLAVVFQRLMTGYQWGRQRLRRRRQRNGGAVFRASP